MGSSHPTDRSLAVAVAAVAVVAMAFVIHAEGPAEFKPDAVFKGSALTGWHVVGDADWKAQNGELIGTAKPGTNGGWLVMDKGFQDLQFFTNYRCTSPCSSGVLLRAQKGPDGGMRGVYVSLTDGDLASYAVTINAQGKELTRERIVAAARAGGAGGGGGGGTGGGARAGAPTGAAAPVAPPAGAATAPAGQGQTGAPATPPGGAGAAPARGGGGGGGRGRGAAATLKAGEWNPVDVLLSAATFRATLGGSSVGGGTLDEKSAEGFGAIAFFVGGTGEARYKDVSWKDINSIVEPKEVTSSRYTAHRINSMYYGWSAAASDINHDGAVDIVAGPFYFLGPGYTERKIYRQDRVYNPSLEYAPDMVNFTADFTGDGWPDILSSGFVGGRPMDLYVNPKGESRRWDHFRVLPTISTEIVIMRDIDGDGKPEILFGGGGVYAYAKPDPANPTAVWTSHPISGQGQAVNIHGIGAGDVNGDRRVDVVVPAGWYEQPEGGLDKGPWTFHPSAFGRGGAEMGVYDVNGDGLSDVVTSLAAHDFGLAWYEQKKAADGSRTFVEHAIAEDFSTTNAGGVVFSEPHASRFVDMDGDKIPDFIVGKRYWSHLENYNGPDPYGAAVVYIYRTVRNPKAPGGAEFVPELVHNRSGVGSAFDVTDLNKDGVPDIAISGAYGTFVFLSKPAARPAAAKK